MTEEIKKNAGITQNLQFLFGQLEETRGRLLNLLSKIPEEIIDKTPDDKSIESIATLLDHIAAVEWSWIFEDIDGEKMGEEWKYAFALRSWSEVKQRTGKSLSFYLDQLNKVRKQIITRITKMNQDDRERIVGQEKQKYTIEWILYHLNHHEAQHHGQISILNRLFNENS
ncbi:MAG: hypothetical protein HeimC2_07220 [Candidatus Heimdallarchaeota archaeon LC_2]|nr:MAG: hypothetical protein HeimC2_07220 [Candidatus Heimdallarchaeota archaeon LC_2]